jgi:chemotaxis protein methyltransferase CheR
MSIAKADFDLVAQLAREEAAIVLEPGKEYLVETRLGELASTLGLPGYTELIAALRTPKGKADHLVKVIDALTTNETLFFRDFHPFETLRKVLVPELMQKRAAAKQLTIWCGACSTGQEPYSIAMLLREHFPMLKDWRVSILATDLSPRVLKQAQEGSFSQLEVNRGLSASYLVKYFTKEGDRWRIKDEIRKLITFKSMNLIQPWPVMTPFDLVFLRNVMIYFDVPTKKTILKRIRGCLLPHGYLFLGSAETTMNIDSSYQAVTHERTVCYSPGASPAGLGGSPSAPTAGAGAERKAA